MRVGLVVPGFSADAADWCIPALRHLVGRLALEDEITVLAVRYPYTAARYRLVGADVWALGGGQRRGLASVSVWRRALGVLIAEHRRRRFDVLHAFWATESGLLAALAGRLLRVPTVVSLAGGELVGLPDIGYGDQLVPIERLKVRAALRLATALTAGSDYQLRLAERKLPTDRRRRLVRVPLGVDVELFNTAPAVRPNGSERLLVHVGALTPVKNQALLLSAVAELPRRGSRVELDVVGDGPLRNQLERLAATLGIQSSVRFRGALPHDQLPSVYRAASAFVLSSRHEAQGMVALEAAACGVPVVGTAVGVVPELAAAGGATAAAGDPTALADAFEAMPTDAGRAARERVLSEFSLDESAGRFRRLYRELSD